MQQDQAANEADPSPNMPESHGAFTAALLETLQVLPADAPASLVYQRVKAMLEGSGVPDQEPDLDATAARRAQPLFGGAAGTADAGKVRTAALKVEDDGSVSLDIGMVPESVRAASSPRSLLRRARPRSIAGGQGARDRSDSATILSPAGAKVQVGDVFELTRLVPAQSSPLRFWIGPANLSGDEIRAAAEQVKASGVATISDAAEEPYTDVLSWNGAAWTLRHV